MVEQMTSKELAKETPRQYAERRGKEMEAAMARKKAKAETGRGWREQIEASNETAWSIAKVLIGVWIGLSHSMKRSDHF